MAKIKGAIPAVWGDEIPSEQWDIYEPVIREALTCRIPFALGGAFALSAYTGSWRNTKDLDLMTPPNRKEKLIQLLLSQGFTDMHESDPYDREWIFRGTRDNVIVDIIWAMANKRAVVNETWFNKNLTVLVKGYELRVMAPEEILWDRLYIIQRDRSGWSDALKLVHAVGEQIDWFRVLKRLGDDMPLLRGLLSVYAWMCPGHSQALPAWLWGHTELPPPPTSDPANPVDRRRAALLDSRNWLPDRPANPALADALEQV